MNAVGFLLFCFYAAARGKKDTLPWPMRTQIIAHRGLTSLHLENSSLALLAALDNGADGLEFDIQLSQDMVPMVFHDRKLGRLSGVQKKIDELSALELSQLRQRLPRYKQNYAIATLEQLMSAMPLGKILNVELKETASLKGAFGIKQVLKVLRPYKEHQRIIISSFDPNILAMVAEQDEYPLGFLLDKNTGPMTLIKAIKIMPSISYLHPHLSLVKGLSGEIAKKLGLSLIVWGHKKMGSEKTVMAQHQCALISDIPVSLIEEYKSLP